MFTKKNYKIKHILNNSSIIVDGFFTEQILMGKGIGFGKKPGDALPVGTKFDKSYQLLANTSEFHRIINGYNENIVEMVMDTIEQMIKLNTVEFTTRDLVTIADHLAAMFERLRRGEAILTFFSKETKTIYPESFSHATSIAKIIYKDHKVELPEAEIAYIALYLENLSSIKTKKEVEQMSSILTQLDELFEIDNKYNIDKDSLAYSRFLIHIHLLVQSEQFKKTDLNMDINKVILDTYKDYKKLAQKIINIIEEEIEHKLSESELIYLIIHLVNLFDNQKEA